jgi:hypothetical protein
VQRKKPNLRDMAARQLLPGGRGTREGKSAKRNARNACCKNRGKAGTEERIKESNDRYQRNSRMIVIRGTNKTVE